MSPPRPANPRLAASDRRAQILDIALNLFSQKSFNGITTKEIAAAAGVTEAIVFRHFPTKQSLYQAVLDSQITCPAFHAWMEVARRRMEENDDEGLMRAIAAGVVENHKYDPRMERLMLFAALEGQQAALDHYRRVAKPVYQLLREYLLRRQQEGALVGFKPEAILTAIVGMAHRYAIYTRLFGFASELSDDEAIDTFTRILMDGIQARPTK